jgi:hypothetical protein
VIIAIVVGVVIVFFLIPSKKPTINYRKPPEKPWSKPPTYIKRINVPREVVAKLDKKVTQLEFKEEEGDFETLKENLRFDLEKEDDGRTD